MEFPALARLPYSAVWCVDTEYMTPRGEPVIPVCLVAHELFSGRKVRLWQGQWGSLPPYPLSDQTLFVAYNAAAELGVHCVLGWNMPMRVLDLWAEFRCLRNHCGKQEEQVPHGLDDALAFYDLDPLDTVEKNWMHDRVLTGGPWSDSDRIRILAACEADVVALANLFKAMFAELDFSKAAIRGRFMATAAQIENLGIPINATLYQRVMHHRSALRRRLIDTCPVPVYENYTLDKDLTAKWVDSLGLRSWPRTAKTRTYMLDKETLKMMGRLCPEVEEFRQLKKSLSTLQDQKKGLLPIGADNRNRFSIRPFMAKTGRNLPLAHTFIFAQAAWFRNLIVAPPGYGLIYADWRQQEFFLAGHLSGDEQMLAAYKTGDPYMAAAIQWGLAPRGASEDTHGTIRDMVKTAVLAIQYGIQAVSLGLRLGKPTAFAAEILRLHKTTYRRYWQWIDSLLDSVSHRRVISTPLGWRMRIKGRLNERSLGNYPMQSTGGDLMRLAACHAVEAGLEIVALIHDAFLALAPLNRLQADAEMLEAYMRQACVDILGTNELRSKTVTFAYPEHFVEKKGLDLYHKVLGLLDELDAEEAHLQPELIPV